MLHKEKKDTIIGSFKINAQDTGSADVQVALLTERINQLNEHLKINKNDSASKAGLIKLVGQRRRFLSYLQKKDVQRYKTLVSRLNLRG